MPYLKECERSNGVALTDISVTPSAVEEKLQKLNPNRAQGQDNIPPRVLKELPKDLSLPL